MNGQLMDQTAEGATPESSHLRRCLRDLVALGTLPALWAGQDPPHIAESLADVLLSMLRPDLVYIGLTGLPHGVAIEAARAAGQPGIGSRAQEIGAALAPWLKLDGARPSPVIPNPLGGGSLRIAVTPIRYEEEWGVAAVGSAHLDFPSEQDRLVLSVAANQAALAIQMARLAEQARQTAVLQERTRMAGEIHDGLGQAFTGILLQLGALELRLPDLSIREQALLKSARDLAREGLTEARRSAHALRPQALEQMDLAAALHRMTAQLSADPATCVTFRLEGEPRPLRPDVADQLLRIGQEALTNAVRHAQAHEVGVALNFTDGELRLSVTDDGQGIATETPLPEEGFGLAGMRERAGLIGAELTVASQPGAGTRVGVTWRFPTS